jgi:hypothetical protein
MAFAAVSGATAILSSDIESNNQIKRSDHEAHFYTALDCDSGFDAIQTDFSRGGTCHSTSKGWESIYLQPSGQGTKPTTNCYKSGDFSGSVYESSGISSGTTSCTG